MTTTPVTFYIPGNVPSSKNSKIATRHGVFISKQTREWVRKTRNWFVYYRKDFLAALEGKEKPYRIGFKFVRDSRRTFDYLNPMQTVQDMMTGGFKEKKTEETLSRTWLEDDNADIILPIPEPYEFKKNDGGVYIIVY